MIDYANRDLLVASLSKDPNIHVIDRSVKQVIRSIKNPTEDTWYNSLRCVHNSSRYLIVKDAKAVSLIDVESGLAQVIYDIPFQGVYCGDDTLLQYIDMKGHLHLLTVGNSFDLDSDMYGDGDRLLADIELI